MSVPTNYQYNGLNKLRLYTATIIENRHNSIYLHTKNRNNVKNTNKTTPRKHWSLFQRKGLSYLCIKNKRSLLDNPIIYTSNIITQSPAKDEYTNDPKSGSIIKKNRRQGLSQSEKEEQ